MNSRKAIFRQTGVLALGQLLCCAAMIGVFSLLGKYDTTVLLGALAGMVLATGNFFFLSLFADIAADKAVHQDVAGGQKMIQLSYMGRMAALFVALILCAKSSLCHPLALVMPLVFSRPILSIAEIFNKKGDHQV